MKCPYPPCRQVKTDVKIIDDQAAIDGFAAFLEAGKGCRPRTVEAYRLALQRLQEFLAGKRLQEAEAAEIEAFATIWLHKRGVVARSRKPYISAVRGFYAWMRQRGFVDRNAATDLRHPKTGKPLPEAISLANAEKLMWAPDLATFTGLRDAAMLALLMGCGLRVSGLVGLQEGDLRNADVDGKVRMVLHAVEKGQKERVLPVPREAEMLLRIYLDHDELKAYDRDVTDRAGRPDRVLFVNTNNRRVPPDAYRGESVRMSRRAVLKMIKRYGRKLEIPERELHPHAFRHLFGTELAEDGVDLLVRQDLMGHADPKSTSIYEAMSMRRRTRVMDQAAPLAKMKTPVSEVLKRL